MKYVIRGEKVEITEAIKKYITEKIGKLDKYFSNPEEIKANVLVRIRGVEQIVEVTIPIKKIVLRCEERDEDLYKAIDLASDKLERQLRKNKTKMMKQKKDVTKAIRFEEMEPIEEKEEMILTGYKRHFSGVPGERAEQEKEMYVKTRPLQYILQALSGDNVSNFDVITNIDDNGYDFYIASRLTEYNRNNLDKDGVLGKEFAGYYENITIPKCTYAIFETERCSYPTLIFLELRKKIASEWLPNSGYVLKDAPELVVTHWYGGEKRNQRYRELWIPIEKR